MGLGAWKSSRKISIRFHGENFDERLTTLNATTSQGLLLGMIQIFVKIVC